MNDKLTQNIERFSAIIDLVCSLIFLGLLLKVYQRLDGLLSLLGG